VVKIINHENRNQTPETNSEEREKSIENKAQ
jgi:hypothetical protein